jgi:signal transduction histidine kinase/HAMP domain-containing protein/CheY-like chemotaxis protein
MERHVEPTDLHRGNGKRKNGSKGHTESLGARPAPDATSLHPTKDAHYPGKKRMPRDAAPSPLEVVLAGLRALADGDFSLRVPVSGDGIEAEIARAVNEVIDRNATFAAAIVRTSNAVGREGHVNERLSVAGAQGAWALSIDAVNGLIDNLVWPTTEVSRVMNAVAEGDLSEKMSLRREGRALEGEFLLIGNTVNTVIGQLGAMCSEVARVAKEVGTEGKLGGQASVPGLAGTWKDMTDNVNQLAGNLTSQVRNIVLVTTAVANGDLSRKITVDAKGEILELKVTLNAMVDQLRTFASEVTRVAREVGTEGKLGGQAQVPGVAGTWKDLTDNVNQMASNLTDQVRGIVRVVTAVANGDLNKKLSVEAKGEVAALAETINNMTDTLRVFAEQVTTVAREVGIEGRLGGQAKVPGAAGTWRDLTDNVNMLAGNLTSQVRNIALVTTAVANGDLSQKITVDARGEILSLRDTINAMVDQLRTFAAEVTRVAREVGIEGKLGGQAQVPGVAGTWKDLTDNVNQLAGNLTSQVRNIALVTTAVANGDLSQKITVDVRGEILELKNTINALVDRLRTFAAEVTRVAREVGTEGKLGGQAEVPGVAGIWKDLNDKVNQMASNLTNQVRGIVKVVTAVADGDLTQKLAVDAKGEIAALADTINGMTDTLRLFAEQVTTVAREVGIEGKLGGQAHVPGASGTWKDLTDNVNMLAGNLTNQVRNIALVTTAVANGDLSKKINVDVRGEILEVKNTINAMVDQLRTFAAEVTRVAKEVGTDGQLGGQAQVPGVAGTWKDLTDNVNQMASNLTDQVRGIVRVVTAVANGDLTKKLVVLAKGEIAALGDTINNMTDTLRTFADQVTTVAREVGIEGRLGGQAKVPGAAGTWRDLTDNVNQLAGNLTTQVRAISEVAKAVTGGDLTRAIEVETQGEVLALKDTINQMIANLRDTTHTNTEQDWLKTNLAKFSSMMQGQRTPESLAQLIMSELTPLVSAQHGAFYIMEMEEDDLVLKLKGTYAFRERKNLSNRFALGEGLVGQCALEKKAILVRQLPEDYVRVVSGLGEVVPRNLIVLPVLFEGGIKGVIELASVEAFQPIHLTFLDQLMLSVGVVVNMIGASARTEELLQELKRSNAELGKKTGEMEEKARLLEVKNTEIAEASANLEEKAKQLALVSKYKSDFLANMSHEVRTPLNSMLILAKLLAENNEGRLTSKQVEYVKTIYAAGNDLLALISQILDLAKIEAGKMEIDIRRVQLAEVVGYVERTFRQVAHEKGLDFSVRVHPDVPATLTTDAQRLQQVLRNLLANAFKFTEKGRVEMAVEVVSQRRLASGGMSAASMLAFAVTDTGIGIPSEKQTLIFEAFQQADSSTSRTYGGTGLGLTISRDLARLLGGEIEVRSVSGEGSTFIFYLPIGMPLPAVTELSAPKPAGGAPAPLTEAGATSEPAAGNASETLAERTRDFSGKKILLVDDDPRNLFAMTSLLERYGLIVLSADSALEGISRLKRHPDIDAVLMDIMMPGLDGYEATREIRKIPEFDRVPVIALTAKAMPGDREKCLESGCTDFVAKPVDNERLIDVLKQSIVGAREGQVSA